MYVRECNSSAGKRNAGITATTKDILQNVVLLYHLGTLSYTEKKLRKLLDFVTI